MRSRLPLVLAGLLLAAGAAGCGDDRPVPARTDCTVIVSPSPTAGKHRPPGGRSSGSRSRPKPKPAASYPVVIVPGHHDGDGCR
ncbi:hypothetical protein AB1484_27305 [Parafrankia sp. FMc6]|uniref:hypothetical protein n=1 Tax=Parafrankia soli TaxID=2599596 RepID=UPI0034D53147